MKISHKKKRLSQRYDAAGSAILQMFNAAAFEADEALTVLSLAATNVIYGIITQISEAKGMNDELIDQFAENIRLNLATGIKENESDGDE